MNSFNVYGQTEQVIGGNTPVWLGTVKPIPIGAKIAVQKGGIIKAGFPGIYDHLTGLFSLATSPSMLEEVNGYLYNDVRRDNETETALEDGAVATCAVVMHHPEGLLIERVYPDITEEQIATLQAKVPGVLLVREPNQSAE